MKVYEVNNLSKVDTTKYEQGGVFFTEKTIGILHNGKIDPMAKKSDIPTKKDIQKIIQDELKRGADNDE